MISEDQTGFNVEESIRAQAEYQKTNGFPDFAPRSGICWSCRQQIYTKLTRLHYGREYTTGISTEKAGKSLVTGCPHCNKSYCD